jgi:hypothetical protein
MYTSELEALQSIQETYITMNELSTATLKSYKDKVHNTSGNDDRKAGSDMAYSKMVSHGDPKVQSSEIISKAKSEIKGLIDPKHHSKYPIDKITGYESARKIYKQAHSAGHLKEDVMDEKFAHPNHKKLDANDNGKVDAQDFALLRKKKGIKNFKEFKESLEQLGEGLEPKSMVGEPQFANKDMMKDRMHSAVRKDLEDHFKKAINYHKNQAKHGSFELKDSGSMQKNAEFHNKQAELAQHHLDTSLKQREKNKIDNAGPSAEETAGTRHVITVNDSDHMDKIKAAVDAHNSSIPKGTKATNGIKLRTFARAGGSKVYLDAKKEHIDKIKDQLSK